MESDSFKSRHGFEQLRRESRGGGLSMMVDQGEALKSIIIRFLFFSIRKVPTASHRIPFAERFAFVIHLEG